MTVSGAEPLRCDWSNRADPGVREVALPGAHTYERPIVYRVCPEHEPRLRAFHAYAQRNRTRFFGAMIVVLFTALAPALTDSLIALALPLGALGVALVAFPFGTPLTVRRNGIARSVLGLRIFGGVLLAFAGLFVVLALV